MRSACARRTLRLLARIPHFIVDAVDRRFCANEALEVGLDEDFEGCGFLLDGLREEVEALEERVGGGVAVDLGEEEGGIEGGGAEEEAVSWLIRMLAWGKPSELASR